MKEIKDVFISAGVAVLVVLLGFMFFAPKEQPIGATPGGDFYNLVQVLGGFIRGNYVSTTTTSTAVTLKVSDVQDKDVINVAQGGPSALTYTFFASSSAASWLPKAGMTQETCFLNATTTAASTLTFAGGTGIDLQIATSTGNSSAMDLTIAANGTACFQFIRKAATATAFDIEANLIEYSDGD